MNYPAINSKVDFRIHLIYAYKDFHDCRESKLFFKTLGPYSSIHSSVTAVRYLDNGNVGKQSVAWKEYCAEYWLKKNSKKTWIGAVAAVI